MAEIPGYLDISAEDFRLLYHRVHAHAVRRLLQHREPAALDGGCPVEAVCDVALDVQLPQREEPQTYWSKWKGHITAEPPRVSPDEIAWSWMGAVLGIGAIACVQSLVLPGGAHFLMLGSFGATAVLVFGAPRSPLSQPRNVVLGHVISALIGVVCWKLLHNWPSLAQALAVATAIAAMHRARALHPPGGATALIATLGSDEITRLGFDYVILPATVGPLILIGIGLVVNNASKARRYPESWR
jgi:CBS-domain-containing membrane protein